MAKKYDPDEEIGLEMEPEEVLERLLHGEGTDGGEPEMDDEEEESEA